jgi:hypothetical protein
LSHDPRNDDEDRDDGDPQDVSLVFGAFEGRNRCETAHGSDQTLHRFPTDKQINYESGNREGTINKHQFPHQEFDFYPFVVMVGTLPID